MIKDIELIEVNDVGIAVVPQYPHNLKSSCDVYFINMKSSPVTNVLISVSGEGWVDGIEKKTTVLRYVLNDVAPKTAVKFEYMLPETLGLSNRYWVSFYENGKIQDKKFLLDPKNYHEENFEIITLLIQPGILLR
jgi:hypothetical protein